MSVSDIPSGTLYTESTVVQEEADWRVTRAACGRTARKLMEGSALNPASLLTFPS
ncbi:PrpF domain-containing protein [Paenibacillus alvei]|uniref:PrpF domain-containing protein n=1 Tax=Paenibacillus alvei TaxID=44250 RepID=UPI0013D9A762|nr:PrpF domain-containing protein [Paenibacillus alvei]NEZ43971.1 hypothetical protein [Paenibacillus alvei]